MNTEQRIDIICDFLRAEVAQNIELKKAFDDDPKRVEWVNPDVHAVYLPKPDPGKDLRSCTPCFVVMPLKDVRERTGGLLTVRIGVMTWDPGKRTSTAGDETIRLEMDREGWRSLYMAMDYVDDALAARHAIGDMTVEGAITHTPYEEGDVVPDLRPYYFGQVDVPMSYTFPQRMSKDIQKLLE